MTFPQNKNNQETEARKQSIADIASKKRYIHLVEKMQRGTLTRPEIAELRQFEAEPLSATIVKTAEEVAKVMDVTYRTVQRWKREGMPVTKDGYYDLEEIKSWHLSKDEKGKRAKGKDFWDEKISKYKAELLKIELQKATGEVILFADHLAIMKNTIRGIKMGFLWLPRYIAPKFYQQDPKVICEILDNELRNIIRQFAGGKDEHKITPLDSEYRSAGGSQRVEIAKDTQADSSQE